MADPRIQPGGAVGVFNPEGIDTAPSAPFSPRLFFGQGAALGWGDELEGWVKSKLEGKTYEQARAEINARNEAFKAKYPVESAYQEFAGAFFPSAASTLFPPAEVVAAPRMAGALSNLRRALAFNPEAPISSGVRLGAGTGAVGGAGTAEPGTRTEGAIYGGLGGGAFGFAVPVTAGVAGNVGKFVYRNLIGPTERGARGTAESKMLELLRSENVEPRDLYRMSQEDYNVLGIPSRAGQYTPGAVESLITMGATPEATKLEKNIRKMTRGQKGRVEQKFKDTFKPGDYYADEANITSQLRTNAKTMYDEAYDVGQINDPRIMKILENPTFKKAFEEAQAISKTEAAAAELAGEDPAKYALKELYVPKEIKPGIFEMELKDIPDVRTLDYVKRGLDAVIERGYKGEGMSTAQANALRKLRNQYVSVIDELVPSYKAARSKYAGDIEVKEALEMGKTAYNRLDPEQIGQFMANASEAEKQAFRTGAMRFLQNTIFDKPNAAGTIVNQRKNIDRLQAMFDSPEEFALVKAALDKEALLYENSSRFLSGSRTEPKKRGVEVLLQPPAGATTKATGGVGNLIGSVMSILRGEEKLPPQVLGKMADMLNAGSPQEVAAVVKALEKREKITAAKVKGASAGLAGTITGGEAAVPEIGADVSGGDVLINELMDVYDNWKSGSGSGGGRSE